MQIQNSTAIMIARTAMAQDGTRGDGRGTVGDDGSELLKAMEYCKFGSSWVTRNAINGGIHVSNGKEYALSNLIEGGSQIVCKNCSVEELGLFFYKELKEGGS